MSHATIHATFAARDILTIPSPRGDRESFRHPGDYGFESERTTGRNTIRRAGKPTGIADVSSIERWREKRTIGRPPSGRTRRAAPAQGQRKRKADSVINAVSHGAAVSPVYWAR